jgi:hypothetical protein
MCAQGWRMSAQGWSMCAQGWRMSALDWRMCAQRWRQVSYQLKTGTVPVFSQNNKKQKQLLVSSNTGLTLGEI